MACGGLKPFSCHEPCCFFLECLNLARPACDFRFWEGQEEEIDRDYLQIASYYTREGKSTTSVKDGRGYAREGVVTPFSEIGKDKTDGYKSPRT